MSFGHPYIMKIDGAIHDGWLLFRKKDSVEVDPDYTYYVLGSDVFYQNFKNLAAGAVVKNLNTTMVNGVEIPLPSLEEQKKIVARLDLLSSKIRELQKLQSETEKDLKDLKQSILHKAFAGELLLNSDEE